MSDYISRQAAIDALEKSRFPGVPYIDTGIQIALREIRAILVADVVPVVHGYWIRHDDADIVEGYYVPEYECSKCGAWKKDDSDFCPDCGARMDGERKENCNEAD